MGLSDWQGSRLIFLSHSGRDKDLADRLSIAISAEFAHRGHQVNVFNTSDPHYRFNEWEELSRAGNVTGAAEAQSREKLRAYLSDNLTASSGYLLLITDQSLAAGSEWVRWEVQEGAALARKHHVGFVPILAGVDFDPSGSRAIPRDAAAFSAFRLDISKPEELSRGVRRIVDTCLADPGWRRAFRRVSRTRANLLRNLFTR